MPAKKSAKRRAPAKPASKTAVESLTPFLWFEKGAEEAARFYVSLFPRSRVVDANPMSVEFVLAGQRFSALNGGPSYKLTPAFSIFVTVKGQKEVDALWSALTADGGEESRCGWLVDRFGMSWQIIPKRLPQLLFHKDPKVAQRATASMLKMRKIDVATLEKAAKGTPER